MARFLAQEGGNFAALKGQQMRAAPIPLLFKKGWRKPG